MRAHEHTEGTAMHVETQTNIRHQLPEEGSLKGLRCIVTGGARGLGEALVRDLARAGARVVFGDILIEHGNALEQELAMQGYDVGFLPVDIGQESEVQEFVDRAAQGLGGIDAVINNAAITNSGGKLATELSVKVWDALMQVNVRGTWLVTVHALPYLRSSGQGRVVNFSSDTVLWGATKLLAYVASKGAVVALTRSMAREFGPDGITVNAVAPGLTEVEATEYGAQERHGLYRSGWALKRTQVPRDVTGPVLFLLSDAARFVTGQVLPINGGFVMN